MPILHASDFNDMMNGTPTGSGDFGNGTTGIDGGASGVDAWTTQKNTGGSIGNFFTGEDPTAHNEAIWADERARQMAEEAFNREAEYNAKQAQAQREYEKMMSDTAFRRKVADYRAAGFSPLAALDGAVGAASPTGSAASASHNSNGGTPARRTSNGVGALFGALITVVGMIATKGMSAVSKAAAATGKAASAASKVVKASKVADDFKNAEIRESWRQHLIQAKKFKDKYGRWPDDL